MKTVTLPGKTAIVGVRLTPAKAETQCQAALVPPVALVAFDGSAWASNITTISRTVPLALQWGSGVIKSADQISWTLGNPDGLDCTFHEAASSTSAALLFFLSVGTVTVTATVDGLELTATITILGI